MSIINVPYYYQAEILLKRKRKPVTMNVSDELPVEIEDVDMNQTSLVAFVSNHENSPNDQYASIEEYIQYDGQIYAPMTNTPDIPNVLNFQEIQSVLNREMPDMNSDSLKAHPTGTLKIMKDLTKQSDILFLEKDMDVQAEKSSNKDFMAKRVTDLLKENCILINGNIWRRSRGPSYYIPHKQNVIISCGNYQNGMDLNIISEIQLPMKNDIKITRIPCQYAFSHLDKPENAMREDGALCHKYYDTCVFIKDLNVLEDVNKDFAQKSLYQHLFERCLPRLLSHQTNKYHLVQDEVNPTTFMNKIFNTYSFGPELKSAWENAIAEPDNADATMHVYQILKNNINKLNPEKNKFQTSLPAAAKKYYISDRQIVDFMVDEMTVLLNSYGNYDRFKNELSNTENAHNITYR